MHHFYVVKNYHRNIGIVVYQTPSKVGMVTIDRCQRVFKIISSKEFASDWSVIDYDVRKAVEKSLEPSVITNQPRARRTLEMIIAILNNQVIAKADDARDLPLYAPANSEIVDLSALETMSGVQVARIHNIITGANMDRARNKGQVAQLIREEVAKMTLEIQGQEDKAAKKAAKEAEKAAKKAAKEAEKAARAAAKAEAKANKPPRSEGAVARVHAICEANRDKARGEVIKLCVEAGLNEGTAKTQYQVWFKKQDPR
jgi:hypothetical protein